MKTLTPAERAAFKVVLIRLKRFWKSDDLTEDTNAEKLIDSMMELAKEMDHD